MFIDKYNKVLKDNFCRKNLETLLEDVPRLIKVFKEVTGVLEDRRALNVTLDYFKKNSLRRRDGESVRAWIIREQQAYLKMQKAVRLIKSDAVAIYETVRTLLMLDQVNLTEMEKR